MAINLCKYLREITFLNYKYCFPLINRFNFEYFSKHQRIFDNLLVTNLFHPVIPCIAGLRYTSTMTMNYDEQHVVTSPNDQRKYCAITLDNGLRALLISDEKPDTGEIPSTTERGSEKMSAAALGVGVGSFSDPPDIPGLAHFLEHMVFMGSEKYPDENGFDSFIKLAGGQNNAFTECEHTVFYFDVPGKSFEEGLDRFAQFFIAPLMAVGSADREIKAVDSEFDMSRTSDKSRKEQLLASVARAGHPMGKFMWGNSDTLKTAPQQQGIDMDARLRQLHQAAYSAHYMTLAVQSRHDLATLERWVRRIFSAVPNNSAPRPTFTECGQPFEAETFCRLYRAVPVKNMHQVEVTWALRPLQSAYLSKPLAYLGFLAGHEGGGSLLAALKARHWATALEAGNSEGGLEFNSTWSAFSVCVTLTARGVDHVPDVITIIHQYLNMLRSCGPQQRIFEELATIEANTFRWQEQCEPCEYVESLSENMLKYPVHHYITGSELMHEYDPALIGEVLEQMTAERACYVILSKTVADKCDCQEPWYSTRYGVEAVPEEWLRAWQTAPPLSELHLPAENTYIAHDFSLVQADVPDTDYPTLITDTPTSRLWYKRDTKFKVPKVYMFFLLRSPVPGATALSAATFDLLVALLRHNLAEVAYAADAAMLSYHVSGNAQGLSLKLSGFHHKLRQLFETVISHVVDFGEDKRTFATVKEQLQRTYHNKAIRPKDLASEIRLDVLQHPTWTVVQRHECLHHVTLDDVTALLRQMRAQLHVHGYVHGNVSATEARSLEDHLLTRLSCSALPSSCLPLVRVAQLPQGERYVRVENLNPADTNSVIVDYFQHGPGTVTTSVLNELMQMRMEEPCFDTLRTNQQLGYDVSCTNHSTEGVLGLSVTVCSQATKFSMVQLHQAIVGFLEDFKKDIADLSEEDFQALVASMVLLKRCEDSHMGEEADRNWTEILLESFLFDRLPKQIAVLERLTLSEFQQWLLTHLLPAHAWRMLSVQVVGNANAKRISKRRTTTEGSEGEDITDPEEDASEDEDDDDDGDDDEEDMDRDAEGDEAGDSAAEDFGRTTRLHHIPTEDTLSEQTVRDLRKFTDSLHLYPVNKLV